MVFDGRRQKLAAFLRRKKVACLLVVKKENIFYLTGLDIEDALLLVSNRGKAVVFSDPRYELELSLSSDAGVEYIIYGSSKVSFLKFVSLELKRRKLKKVALEGYFSIYAALELKRHIKHLRNIYGAVENIRNIKETYEISLIEKAASLGRLALRQAACKLRGGITEERIAFFVEKFVLKHYFLKAGLAFNTLVTSGRRLALPHGLPTSKVIKTGECVLVDMGVKINGYNSDLTRMLSVGRISSNEKKLVTIVRDAQRFAIEKIKPGIKASVIDKAARGFIEKKGYAKFFIHATGHGIGLEVHEKPTISSKSREILKAGMVFTVEPAIYMPGVGGARVEEMVLVGEEGFKVL